MRSQCVSLLQIIKRAIVISTSGALESFVFEITDLRLMGETFLNDLGTGTRKLSAVDLIRSCISFCK